MLANQISKKAYDEVEKLLSKINGKKSELTLTDDDLASINELKSDEAIANWYYHHVLKAEGVSGHIYLDSKGKPTIGKGHLLQNLSDAKHFPFKICDKAPKKGSNSIDCPKNMKHVKDASEKDIEKAINFINEKKESWKGKFKKHTAPSYYDKDNNYVVLDEDSIESLAKEDIMGKIKELKHKNKFPNFSLYPPSAQIALLEMGYNIGVPNLAFKFHKGQFAKLVRDQAWYEIAYGNKKTPVFSRGGIGVERNSAVNILFILADEWKKSNEWFRDLFRKSSIQRCLLYPEKNGNMTPWLSPLLEINMSKL